MILILCLLYIILYTRVTQTVFLVHSFSTYLFCFVHLYVVLWLPTISNQLPKWLFLMSYIFVST